MTSYIDFHTQEVLMMRLSAVSLGRMVKRPLPVEFVHKELTRLHIRSSERLVPSLCKRMKRISYGKQRETENNTREVEVVTDAMLEPPNPSKEAGEASISRRIMWHLTLATRQSRRHYDYGHQEEFCLGRLWP